MHSSARRILPDWVVPTASLSQSSKYCLAGSPGCSHAPREQREGSKGKVNLFPLLSSGEALLGSKHLHKTSWLQWTGARKCCIFFWAALVLARFLLGFAMKASLYASAWLVWTISSAHELSFTCLIPYAILFKYFSNKCWPFTHFQKSRQNNIPFNFAGINIFLNSGMCISNCCNKCTEFWSILIYRALGHSEWWTRCKINGKKQCSIHSWWENLEHV